MLAINHERQIQGIIVQLVLVDVMNMLANLQSTLKQTLCNNYVLSNVFALACMRVLTRQLKSISETFAHAAFPEMMLSTFSGSKWYAISVLVDYLARLGAEASAPVRYLVGACFKFFLARNTALKNGFSHAHNHTGLYA